MKKILILIAGLLPLLFSACKEDFDPKSEFREHYVLNIVIRPDTTVQLATLSHSYSVTGYDPYENRVDPSIVNADIRIIHDDKVYVFKDSSAARLDSARYTTPVRYYYCSNFLPAANREIKVRCQLNNGKLLTAATVLPQKLEVETGSARLIPQPETEAFTFKWKKDAEGTWFLPKLILFYKIFDGKNYVPHSKEVKLISKTGADAGKLYSPGLTRSNAITFDKAALDSAMNSLAHIDPAGKTNIYIYSCTLEVLIFDSNLSAYYSTIHGYMDDLTVKIDGSDYTNIDGGYGILGSYMKGNVSIGLTTDYIRDMGYQVGRK